jgi:hypothetical protein
VGGEDDRVSIRQQREEMPERKTRPVIGRPEHSHHPPIGRHGARPARGEGACPVSSTERRIRRFPLGLQQAFRARHDDASLKGRQGSPRLERLACASNQKIHVGGHLDAHLQVPPVCHHPAPPSLQAEQ